MSKASDDLPEPDGPVTTTSLFFGIFTLTFFKLCCLAPVIFISCSNCVSAFQFLYVVPELSRRLKVELLYRFPHLPLHLGDAFPALRDRRRGAHSGVMLLAVVGEAARIPA